MTQTDNTRELFRACEILFGSDLDISYEFLDYLQISGVKSAYRKRAMETHPDRFAGRDLLLLEENTALFTAIREAYENLLNFLQERESGRRAPEQLQRNAQSAPPSSTSAHYRQRSSSLHHQQQSSIHRTISPIILPDHNCQGSRFTNSERYYEGPLPHRQLLFGHFLYYCGLANWRTITRILTWQRSERPKLGELGRRLGMFNQEDITTILNNRIPSRPFGETARMLGMVSDYQLRVLIFHQQRLQKKFGTILLEKNLLRGYELEILLEQFERHNADLLEQH